MKNFMTAGMEKMTDRMAYGAAAATLAVRRETERFLKNEDGETNLVSILLIIVVTVALVAIFKTRITDLVNTIFDKIKASASKI